jgi:hypothetical protein
MIESDLTSTTSSGTAIQLGNTDGSLQGCQIDSEFYQDGMQVRSMDMANKLIQHILALELLMEIFIDYAMFG